MQARGRKEGRYAMRRRRLWWLWVSWVLTGKQAVLPWPSSSSVGGAVWLVVKREPERKIDLLCKRTQSASQGSSRGSSSSRILRQVVASSWVGRGET
jgi:hypothetical protein